MRFSVLLPEVQAALLFASRDDSRYFLNSVLFEVRPGKKPLLVSTDGRRLAVIESGADQGEDPLPTLDLIIRAADLKNVCAYHKKQCGTFSQIAIEFHPADRVIFEHLLGHAIDIPKGAVIDGDFPNWRQIVPGGDREPVSDIAVCSDYIKDYALASKLLNPKEIPCVKLNIYTKESAFDVRLGSATNFYSVLMPMRDPDPGTFQPSFIFVGDEKA